MCFLAFGFFSNFERNIALRPNLSMWVWITATHYFTFIFENLDVFDPFVFGQAIKFILPNIYYSRYALNTHFG
ncbi:hypothetical protein D3C85_1303340 [compost metagenome]